MSTEAALLAENPAGVAEPSHASRVETQVGVVTSISRRAGESREAPRRGVGRNIQVLAGSQVLSWGMAAVWTLVVSRALGPSRFGLVVSATSVSGIIGIILAVGSQTYLARDIVRDPKSGPQIVGTAMVLKLALVPIVVLVTIVFAELAHYGHEARIVLLFASAMTALTALAVPSQAVFQALERMQYLAWSNLIGNTAQGIIGVVIVLVGLRAEGVMASMAVVAGGVLILNMWWLRRHMRIDFRARVSTLATMSRRSAPLLVSSVFATIYLWIDTVMLSMMTSSRVVGWYGATTTLFQTLLFLPSIIATAWLPRLVSAFGDGREELLAVARAPIQLTLILSIPLAAGTAMFAHVAVVVFYGHRFSSAAPVLVALAVCIPPISMNIILARVATAAGQERIWAGLMIAAAFVNPAINLALITFFQHYEHNGAIGAAWAMVLTEVLLDTVGLLVVGRRVFGGGVMKRLGLTCCASGAMLLAYHFAGPLGQPLALTVGVGVFVGVALKVKVVNQEELGLLIGFARKLIPLTQRGSLREETA